MPDQDFKEHDYLSKHLEPRGRLAVPLGAVDYKTQTNAEIENPTYSLSLSFKPLQWDGSVRQSALDWHEYWTGGGTGNNYLLENFSLTNRKNSARVSLSDLVPQDSVVFFDPTVDTGYSMSEPSEKTILAYGDLTEPKTIITLAHEAGHLSDEFSNSDKAGESRYAYEDRKNTQPTAEQLADLLRSERNAWAFALKKLRPLFDKSGGLTKENFLAHMRNQLTQYSEAIANTLETEFKEEDPTIS